MFLCLKNNSFTNVWEEKNREKVKFLINAHKMKLILNFKILSWTCMKLIIKSKEKSIVFKYS